MVEDCAHAHGCTINDKPAGSFGDVGTFSYVPTKVITANEGGMIVTDRDDIYRNASAMRDHGKLDRNTNLHQIDGNSWRMTEINALIGTQQMERLQEFLVHRAKMANIFDEELAHQGVLHPLPIPKEGVSNYYKYIVRPINTDSFDRDRFKQRLREEHEVGLSGEVYTHGCHEQPVLQNAGFKGGPFPNAAKFCKSHLCLPIYNNMTEKEARIITSSIRDLILKS